MGHLNGLEEILFSKELRTLSGTCTVSPNKLSAVGNLPSPDLREVEEFNYHRTQAKIMIFFLNLTLVVTLSSFLSFKIGVVKYPYVEIFAALTIRKSSKISYYLLNFLPSNSPHPNFTLSSKL